MNVFYLEYFICRRNTYQIIPSAQMLFNIYYYFGRNQWLHLQLVSLLFASLPCRLAVDGAKLGH